MTEAAAILERTKASKTGSGTFIQWHPGDKTKAFALADKPIKDANCPACNIEVYNILCKMEDLPPISTAAPASLFASRLAICHSCKYLAKETKLRPAFPYVELKGISCTECGCIVRAKAALNNETCPKDKW